MSGCEGSVQISCVEKHKWNKAFNKQQKGNGTQIVQTVLDETHSKMKMRRIYEKQNPEPEPWVQAEVWDH